MAEATLSNTATEKIRASAIYRAFYYVLVLALLAFGTGFSKFHIAGPLYLHDLLLSVFVLLTLFRPVVVLPFSPVVLLVAISVVYLVVSFLTSDVRVDLIIRQYAIFGYMIFYYLLYIKGFWRHTDYALRFLTKIGLLCIALQIAFIAHRIYAGLTVFADYNYFSPITVLGIIVGSASILAFSNSLLKYFLFLGVLLVSATTGHSSAFLSVFAVGAFYFFFRTTNKSKAIIIILIIGAVLCLYLLVPQFQDANAGFRLIAWEHTLRTIIIDNYGVVGEGFGVPYFDSELIDRLYRELGSVGFFGPDKVDEPYLSSVHNSFLTIFFSVGLLPGLLILVPFYRMSVYLLNRRKRQTDSADFIYLSLIGLSVWVSFNQILEVPHSTALFWLVYFASLSIPADPKQDFVTGDDSLVDFRALKEE